MIKSKREIEYLTAAADITKKIWAKVSKKIKPEATEKSIVRAIEENIARVNLKRSFKTIVASGPNGAKPHAKPTERRIKNGDSVVVDFGVVYKGYHSDMTRTVFVGKPNKRMKKIYDIVKKAQEMAIKNVRSGIKISHLVAKVHDYIRGEKLGKYILHSLGHGLGRKIHEAPKLSEKNNGSLKRNMAITIEPGLYIEGLGGVRIEDMVLVGTGKPKVLTR
ncbi:MAG: M24 family metallopeptidase [Candidatus Omnitrophota bacterium]